MNTLVHIAVSSSYSCVVMFLIVDVFLWCLQLWKEVVICTLNVYIWIIIRWLYRLPHLCISLEDIGFLKAHNVVVKWKNNVILNAETLTLKVEFSEWRSLSFKLQVTNLQKVADSFEAIFSFTLFWRIFPLNSTSTGLEHNSEIQNSIKPKITRLQATTGKIILKCTKDGQASKGSPKIVIKIKAGEAVFTSGTNIFIINGRANKVTCDLKGRRRTSNHRDHLIEMACLRLKFVFPKDSPHQLSLRYQGARVRITRNNVKTALWTLTEYKHILLDNDDGDCNHESEPERPASPHNNTQLSKVKIFAEDLVLSFGTPQVPEIAAINISLDVTTNNWIGKCHCSGTVGLQGVSVSDIAAVDPCIIIGNDLITASWRCYFNTSHVYKRCLIFNAESSEILSMIVRPDYYEVLSQLRQEYSFLTEDKGKANLSQLGESMKLAMEEYCPRTQISTTFEGVNVCFELDMFEKLATCTLEDIRLQCTRDSENLTCDFTVKVIEVEDRINNVLALRRSSTDGDPYRSIHVTAIQEATTEKRSVTFQQLYGELADFTITIEEELLLKLLIFCRITTKNQLWGEQDEIKKESSSPPSDSGQSSSAIDDGNSLCFERLEMAAFNVVCWLSPKQELPEDLAQLKETLGIPNGLPPCVENARLDFERFLRRGIYYRSFDGLARDLKRHYLKEVGRQSAKILGSLHLLGNVTGLRDNIAEGLAELRETGDYMGFAGHVRHGLTESYYKIADSWSAYVKTPTKIPKSPENAAPKTVEEPKLERTDAQPYFLSSLSSSLGGWVFNSQNSESQPQHEVSTRPVSPEQSHVVCHTPPCDRSLRDSCNAHEDDAQSSFSMSCITTPTSWEVIPQQTQKQLKGQEFLRRLKQSMDDTETEEKFICCLRLRYANPKDKLNVLITSRKLYLMTVGLPTTDNVVLAVSLEKLFEAKEKDEGEVNYLELIMRINGMQRLSLPSPNPEDNPLVRCDSRNLAIKAAKRINKAKKTYYPTDYCPCSVLLNGANFS